MKLKQKEYLRSAMFGFNDALVSTTGVIVGVSTGTQSKSVIILAGVVTIMVEALSMGSGQYLSAKAAHEYEGEKTEEDPLISGTIMAIAYFLAGLVPLTPILLFPVDISREVSIVAALTGLGVLGYAKAKLVGVPPLRSTLELLIIGGAATAIGIVAGSLLNV